MTTVNKRHRFADVHFSTSVPITQVAAIDIRSRAQLLNSLLETCIGVHPPQTPSAHFSSQSQLLQLFTSQCRGAAAACCTMQPMASGLRHCGCVKPILWPAPNLCASVPGWPVVVSPTMENGKCLISVAVTVAVAVSVKTVSVQAVYAVAARACARR